MFQKSWRIFAVIAGCVILGNPSLALAFQNVQVGPSGAIIYGSPQANAAMTGTLRPGQTVRVLETPTGSYFRVIVGGKYVGWVQESALNVPHHHQEAAQTTKAMPPAIPEHHEPPQSYLGAFGGLGIAGGGSSMGFGVDGGYKLSPMWSLGIYFEYLGVKSAAATNADPTAAASASLASNSAVSYLIMTALELNYYILRVPGLYVGAKAGLGITTSNATASPTTTTALGAGATGVGPAPVSTPPNTSTFLLGGGVAAGYDYPVYSTFTAGAEANVFFLTGDITSHVINVVATLKFVF